jgi:chorismate mutase
MFSLLLGAAARINVAASKPGQIPIKIEQMSPPDQPSPAPPPLAELRREIDRIDEAMHRLLLERGDIIGRLITVKRTAESGSAFRPAREADMMRRLVERHRGILPLDTAESIWRVIIATFTYVQAPYRVHADFSVGEPAMRDCERFHFGFTVPLVGHMGAGGVVAAVAATTGDLGLVPIAPGAGVWWAALEAHDAPKIIARLPFVEREDHPAGLPVYAIARPHPDAIVTDVEMWSFRVAGWGMRPAQALANLTEAVAVPDRGFDGAALLVPVPRGRTLDEISGALVEAGASVRSRALVGSHATRYTVAAGANPVPTGR